MIKHWKYLKTVLKHKWFVFLECAKRGLIWQGIFHDWHKFLPNEWFAYVENFQGTRTDEVKSNFIIAMNFHMNKAKHHWNYWVYLGYDEELIPLKMPKKHALEMFCDWLGASKAYTGNSDCSEWYEMTKDKIVLHPETRKYVEELIYD